MGKISKQSQVTLIELPPTQFGIFNGPLSYDEFTMFTKNLPSRALPTLEGCLRANGWSNVQSLYPLHQGKDGKLTEQNLRRIWASDVLVVSSITRTAPSSMGLIELYKANNPKGTVIVGGPDPTFRPEEWLKAGADVVVFGEGDVTLAELTERLIQNNVDLGDVAGIAFKQGSEIIKTTDRKFMTLEEFGDISHPYYDDITRAHMNIVPIQLSRGCPRNCNFCSVIKMNGRGTRPQSSEWVVEELRRTQGIGEVTFYTDDNLYGNLKLIEVLEAIGNSGLNHRISLAQFDVDAVKNQRFLDALDKAKVDVVCLGIESISDKTLQGYGKRITAEDNKEAVRELRRRGKWVHAMMAFGGEGDDPSVIEKTIAWFNDIKYGPDSIQPFIVTPFPGTEFYGEMKAQGRILTEDWSLYDAQHEVIRFDHFKPGEVQDAVLRMYGEFFSVKNTLKRVLAYRGNESWKRKTSLVISSYANFTGFRKMSRDPQYVLHRKFLDSLR